MMYFNNLNAPMSREFVDRFAKTNKRFFFELTPRILPVGESEIIIKCTDSAVKLEGEFLVLVVPYYDYCYKPFETYRDRVLRVKANVDSLTFRFCFESEQMYEIMVGEETESGLSLLLKSRVYALEKDLFLLKPLIGDLHCHTYYSDGLETPEGVLKAAIRNDFDFIAVTDHNNYEGSVEAGRIQTEKCYPITVINGEEYSCSFTNMHILSLGADRPLKASYYLMEESADNRDASAFELTKELCRQISGNGGVSVMCHPLWKPFKRDGSRGDVPLSLVKSLMEAGVFDAVEIVSGSPEGDHMTSLMQVTWAVDFGATPARAAYIGTTDSHIYSTDRICGKHFTLVLAEEDTQEAIIEAIRQKRTVAIQLVDEKNALCFGSSRLCMFAQFYMELRGKIRQ